jgi:hypothetical protein
MEQGDVPLSEKRFGEARAPRTTPETGMIQNLTISDYMGCRLTLELFTLILWSGKMLP